MPGNNAEVALNRTIGSLDARQDGPLVVLLSGLHGNEYVGVRAVEEVLDILKESGSLSRGR
ncbi:MAG TPA: hypothetical protein VK074_06690, partial [Fodinibius sp.]|nr:hypothetical protein [Fodinibius sp.]